MPLGDRSIGFSTTVEDTQTRSGALATGNLLSMGIFAYYTGSNDWTISKKPNFMYNQEVKRSNASSPWTYSPVKYWPNNPGDKLTFFAYAPYVKEVSGSNPSFRPVTDAGYPTFNYTVPVKDNDQTDLLVSIPPLMNQTYGTNNGKVSLHMSHALTRVSVYLKSGDNVQGKQVTVFSMQATKKAILGFRTPTPSYTKYVEWTYLNPIEMITVSPSVTLPFAVPAVKDEKKLLADFFLLPAARINESDHKFSITYTTAGTASSGDAPVQTVTLSNQTLPSMNKWEFGAYVSYTFLIEKQKLTVTATSHPTWGDAGTGTVTGSVVITYAENESTPNWSNGGSGSVDGKPVVTHSTVQNDVQWEDGGTEIVEKS
ncbi:fimbrillin family protein [Bacteroides xylanisolvens]|uniref:fimbrillin family protein n=1 Tax=Bacteroides TaxID=816 RepID=UPI001E5ACFC8|nr:MULTISPECIES: fimbrillin family protein [Bacteroides]MDB0712397.1 fimbrillin family protein [Bacteroides xylanisolvens]